MKKCNQNEIKEAVQSFIGATGINCFAFSAAGEVITPLSYWNRSTFCSFVQGFDYASTCKQSYFYGGIQAEKIGEAYIYFCPYGLVNWTVPVIISEKKYFITAGPILMHKVDELLIKDLIEQNHLLKTRYREVRARLSELSVVDPDRVKDLADILLRIAKSLMIEDSYKLETKRQMNIIKSNISEVINKMKKEIQIQNKKIDLQEVYIFEKEKQLIEHVKAGDKKSAREILNELLSYIYIYHEFDIVKLKVISLMVVLTRTAIEVGANLEIIFGMEYFEMRKILDVNDIDELSVELSRILDRFMEWGFSSINIENRNFIFKAMNYIRNNYAEISLQDVASEVSLNPTYFSKLFKEETGKSYTEYLNKVRIEKSKKYLKKGMPLSHVAQSVGFSDQSYFSKIFKKYEGVSPNKWRKNNIP